MITLIYAQLPFFLIFSNNLKNAEIIPTFKKNERINKSNNRPISILPTLSKIYEKILFHQIYKYFNNMFSKYLGVFRKGHGTQHSLLFMLESLKKAVLRYFINRFVKSFWLYFSWFTNCMPMDSPNKLLILSMIRFVTDINGRENLRRLFRQ